MGWNPPPSLVVFLVILAAACAVMIAYSMYRIVGGDFEDNGPSPPGLEQAAYMRELRRRNLDQLYHELRVMQKS